MSPFFSVVICTFNRARLLPRALDSLRNQSEGDWEAVIIDDGSSDETAEVVQEFVSVDPRIRFLRHGSNRGLSAARNSGVEASKGRFVTFLDSDDEYTSDHLATRKALLTADASVRFLHGGVKVIGDPFVIDKDNTTDTVHIDNCVLGGTFVVRRDVFEELEGFDHVPYAEDTLFYERAVAAGIRMLRTYYPSYIYYRNIPNQLSSSFTT